MALTKPLLYSVPAWDVATGYTFTFNVTSGDQVTGNTLYIRDNTTNQVVFQQAVTSFRYENTVPPNASLTNGKYYNAYITTTNAAGQTSPQSNVIQFYCYSAPTMQFTNVIDGGTVGDSTFAPIVEYNQAQGEMLNSYIINLYNFSQVVVATSGVQYVGSTSSLPIQLSYPFSGLEDNTIYYVSCSGVTVNNTQVTTGLVQFTASYITPSGYTKLGLINNCDEGYITVSSNVVLIDGIANPDPPTYIDNDAVDLKVKDSWVMWNDGFDIVGDFTIQLWMKEPNINTMLMKLENKNGQWIELNYLQDQDDSSKVFVELEVQGGYIIYSASVTAPTSTQQVVVVVRKSNNIYDIQLEVE